MVSELVLILGLATVHSTYNDHYNNDNQLVMVQHEGWTIGTMINSYDNRSFMAGYDFNIKGEYSQIGFMVGGVTGYNKDSYVFVNGAEYRINKMTGLPVMPMVAPYLRIDVSKHVDLQVNMLGSALNASAVITF